MNTKIKKFWQQYGMQILRILGYSIIVTAIYLIYLFSYGIPATQERLEEVGVQVEEN